MTPHKEQYTMLNHDLLELIIIFEIIMSHYVRNSIFIINISDRLKMNTDHENLCKCSDKILNIIIAAY